MEHQEYIQNEISYIIDEYVKKHKENEIRYIIYTSTSINKMNAQMTKTWSGLLWKS